MAILCFTQKQEKTSRAISLCQLPALAITKPCVPSPCRDINLPKYIVAQKTCDPNEMQTRIPFSKKFT